MSENNSLNEKYEKYEDELTAEAVTPQEEPQKEKKAKKEKAPKEKKPKKEKAPKEPKEKKVKEKKPKKEKIKKEKRGLKEKKNRDDIALPVEIIEEPVEEILNVQEEPQTFINDRQREEITFDNIDVSKLLPKADEEVTEAQAQEASEETENTGVEVVTEETQDSKKEKKSKKEKTPKPKKEKKVKEKKPRDPIGKKDIATIIIAIIAIVLALAIGFYSYFNSRTEDRKGELVNKYKVLGIFFPDYVSDTNVPNNTNTENKNLADAQIVRDGILVNLVQTDIPNVFYGVNTDYTVQYYQYRDNKMVPVKYTDSIPIRVDMGSATLNFEMNYIKIKDYVYGVSVFTSNNNEDVNYFYDLVVFKLTILPSAFKKDDHALLLASTDKAALLSNDIMWSESFDVNLKSGDTSRFLSVINRTIDDRGAGVTDFCILPKAGYTTKASSVPFITSREYPVGSGLQDIFIKTANGEKLLASDVYGKYFVSTPLNTVYLRKTTTGFDVIHNINGNEKIAKSFYGFMGTNYTVSGKYIISKGDGHIYDILSGKDYTLVGYSMNTDAIAFSNDGRYVVMMGTVKNAVDYQIHVFDLQTGEYVKLPDKNYAPHMNIYFIDNNTVVYTAVDPNKGYEYVVLDIAKAFENNK